jgi:hypothetical protein
MVPRLFLVVIMTVSIAVGGVLAYHFAAATYPDMAIHFDTVY